MSDPSTSKNVSSRRTRVARRPEPDEDDIQIIPQSVLKKVDINAETKNAILEMIQKNSQQKIRLTSSNCFETKSPLDLYNVEQIIASDVKIQDMAIVLDTTQQIYSARVDRLFTEVRGCEISMTKGTFPTEDEAADGGATKQKSKRKNLETGAAEMEEVLNRMGEDNDDEDQQENEEEDVAPVVLEDPVAGLEWQMEWDIGEKIKELTEARIAIADKDIFTSASSTCLMDSRSFDIPNTDIDWLQSNTYYQKAMVGSVDDVTSSFHSLLSNGMYSDDARIFKLHPRITESPADRPVLASQVQPDVVTNMRKIIKNSMEQTPVPLTQSLMFDLENRQRTGQLRPKRQEVQVSRVNTTASQDTTMITQDLTIMIPAERAASVGPSTSNMQDTTLFGAASPPEVSSMNTDVSMANEQAVSSLAKSGALRASEYEVPAFTDLLIDDHVNLAMNEEFNTGGLEACLRVKADLTEQDDESKKEWRRGMLAEEWFDPTNDMVRACQHVLLNGMDAYIKQADSMINSDVVKMVFNKETIHKLDQELQNLENENGKQNVNVRCPSIPDRYFVLKKSEAYKTLYPPDRQDYFHEITNEDENIPIEERMEEGEPADNDEPMDDNYANQELVYNEDLAVDQSFDDAGRNVVEHVPEHDPVAEGFFGADEPPLDNIVRLAVDETEVADLAANLITEPGVQIRPEMETEIQNLGQDDNTHWKAPNVGATESITTLAKKKKDRKKPKKITVDDFAHYFEPTSDADKSEKISEVLCKHSKTAPWVLKESQVLVAEIPIESKPFIAFEFEQLSRSGVMFRKKYGKLQFGREAMSRRHREDVLVEEEHKEDDSECLNWLLSFTGFRCFDIGSEDTARIRSENDQVYVNLDEPNQYFDDNDDYYDEEYLRQEAMLKMSESTSQKFLNVAREADNMRVLYNKLNRREEGYSDDDEENDEERENYFGQRNAFRAKNLDAAKHKKCIADVLNSPVLTAQNIDYMISKLTEGSLTATGEMQDPEEPSVLESVFKFRTHDVTVDVEEIIEAFNAVPDYNDAESGEAGTMAERLNRLVTTTDPIDPSNPPVERVQVAGVKTFMSVVTCAPSKMGDISSPAGLLSFSLHLCNENGIHLFQDRTQPFWMNDFMFINKGEGLPTCIIIGDGAHRDLIWDDPFGRMRESSSYDQPGPSRSLQPVAENPDLSNIVEEDEEEEMQEDA